MNRPLRIAVADDEPDMREYYQKVLPRLGHEVVAAAGDGAELVRQCRNIRPDLVITDIKMPHTDGIDAAVEIYRDRPLPVILVSAFYDPDLIQRAESDHVVGYLVKPIKQSDLVPAIALAMRGFEQFQELRKETTDLRQALDDRKVIEHAKSILMKRDRIDEQAAFGWLKKQSSEERRRLVEIAQSLVVTEESTGE